MLLFGKKCQGYQDVRSVLNGINFLDQLLNFMPSMVKPSTLIMLKSYTEQPDFNPESIKCVSKACVGLCMWVLAV